MASAAAGLPIAIDNATEIANEEKLRELVALINSSPHCTKIKPKLKDTIAELKTPENDFELDFNFKPLELKSDESKIQNNKALQLLTSIMPFIKTGSKKPISLIAVFLLITPELTTLSHDTQAYWRKLQKVLGVYCQKQLNCDQINKIAKLKELFLSSSDKVLRDLQDITKSRMLPRYAIELLINCRQNGMINDITLFTQVAATAESYFTKPSISTAEAAFTANYGIVGEDHIVTHESIAELLEDKDEALVGPKEKDMMATMAVADDPKITEH